MEMQRIIYGRRARFPCGGFTLLELLVVLVIIGLLAGYVGPNYFSQIGKSEVKATRAHFDARPHPGEIQTLAPALGETAAGSTPSRDPALPPDDSMDPVTGKAEWGLITGPGGEIYGVHSRSDGEPLRKHRFELADDHFKDSMKYSDWVFMHSRG